MLHTTPRVKEPNFGPISNNNMLDAYKLTSVQVSVLTKFIMYYFFLTISRTQLKHKKNPLIKKEINFMAFYFT